jgi:hypothetical protein
MGRAKLESIPEKSGKDGSPNMEYELGNAGKYIRQYWKGCNAPCYVGGGIY